MNSKVDFLVDTNKYLRVCNFKCVSFFGDTIGTTTLLATTTTSLTASGLITANGGISTTTLSLNDLSVADTVTFTRKFNEKNLLIFMSHRLNTISICFSQRLEFKVV